MIQKINNELKSAGRNISDRTGHHHYSFSYLNHKAMLLKALLIAAVPTAIMIAILKHL